MDKYGVEDVRGIQQQELDEVRLKIFNFMASHKMGEELTKEASAELVGLEKRARDLELELSALSEDLPDC